MTLLIDNRQSEFDVMLIQKFVETVVAAALKEFNINNECQISITLTDNKEIQDINREYRNINLPTDVLSFPMIEYDKGRYLKDILEEEIKDITNIDIDTGELVLGDIIISLEKAHEQSAEYGHSFEREVAYLTVHGILHLMGYDHEIEEDKKTMRDMEEEILRAVNIAR